MLTPICRLHEFGPDIAMCLIFVWLVFVWTIKDFMPHGALIIWWLTFSTRHWHSASRWWFLKLALCFKKLSQSLTWILGTVIGFLDGGGGISFG